MNQERFWILFSRKLSEEITPEEMSELESIIQEHEEWHIAAQHLENTWNYRPAPNNAETEDAYLIHLQRMQDLNIPFGDFPRIEDPAFFPAKKTAKIKWYWAAASFAAVIAIAAGLFSGNIFGGKPATKSQGQASEVTTRPGSKSQVVLPDGSRVWLNAGSKLTYNNKDFGKEIREVALSGEGYFDVAKMKDKPFIIHTSSINIKVLGTVFNVKAYPEDKQTETSLIKGSIEVTIHDRPNDKIILSPSEKLVVENKRVAPKADSHQPAKINTPAAEPMISLNKLVYKPIDSTVAETEWVNNRLVFRDETFEDLSVRMERWYNINIEITDERLANAKLNGTFENESVTQALDALTEMLPFRYEKKGNSITIKR